ncbi:MULTISPECIES: cytochrome b [Roseobacteraceae]|uniref:Cytochrome b561 n=1 Tax=Pseudosulfitobacter pseudonitzschiae TaxID=1402135 RepID=A0A221K696_9RHOB|nr:MULTISPECIES: cytochrome b [Roseobacteraceae]ASM74496.1 cytochrome b561 [Pseudosulfitobacter pseudonitzschiae]
MATLSDQPNHYGLVTRTLHWGMAALFAAQFTSAAAHWALPRENALREALWGYHGNLGATLFLLVLLRGVWGLMNIQRRPRNSGTIGQAAVAGHVVLYALMVIVPAVRLLAAAGSTRGFSYFGIPVFPARETAIAWTQVAVEWHGEMGWILGLVIVGHIAMAIVWHQLVKRDDVLTRMT